MGSFRKRSVINASADDLFAWHERQGAFQRLVTPWDRIDVLEQEGTIHDGDRIVVRIHQGPARIRLEARHTEYTPGRLFVDYQHSGPFARWRHEHSFTPDGPDRCVLDDHIEYAMPAGTLGEALAGWYTSAMLDRMFTFRHQRTRDDMNRHAQFADQPRQKIAITGSTGMVGEALCAFLSTGGHEVYRVVRRPPKHDHEIFWKPSEEKIDAEGFEGMDAVIHLAGANVGGRRWTESWRREIIRSRQQGTHLLARTLARLERPPRVLLSASAVGFYGSAQGDTVLDETSPRGGGYLARVCEVWEESADPAREAGIRTVHPRIGVVLDPSGGALEKMLTPFRAGVGGPIGSGRQYMSWVSMDDVIGALYFLLFHEEIDGPVNLVAPTPETNADLAKTLGRVLNRPAIIPAPAAAVRLAMGREMADETALASQRALPTVLQNAGFAFCYPDLEGALRHVLGRPA